MAKLNKKIKRIIVYYSLQEKKKRELRLYKDKVKAFKEMEADKIDLEYINLKSEYEHRKVVLSIFMVSIIISVVMNIWKYFYEFVEKAIYYASSGQANKADEAYVVFAIFSIIIGFITVVVIVALIMYVRKMYQISKELIIVEELRKKCRQ